MKLIDADALLKQLGVSERFNADIPAWVIGVIKGMPSAEPEQKETICGYDIDNIILFAMMCRKVGITNDNLRDFALECSFAYEQIHKALYDEVTASIMRTFEHCKFKDGAKE